MDASNQNQALQGSGLQNTSQLQTGQQTNGLQQQDNTSSNYKQLQQNALGSDAYRNFDGLKVQQGMSPSISTSPNVHYVSNQSAWPSVWVWLAAVALFFVYINAKKMVTSQAKLPEVESTGALAVPATTSQVTTKKSSKSKKSNTHKVTSKKKKSAKKSKK